MENSDTSCWSDTNNTIIVWNIVAEGLFEFQKLYQANVTEEENIWRNGKGRELS